jgi:hypothetical protein
MYIILDCYTLSHLNWSNKEEGYGDQKRDV